MVYGKLEAAGAEDLKNFTSWIVTEVSSEKLWFTNLTPQSVFTNA